MKYYYLIIILLILLLIFYKKIEHFEPNEIISNYIPFGNKYCLITKEITDQGGKYISEVKQGNIPALFDNQKAILINNEFTEQTCINKDFGSGRQRGGFVCMDFLTKKMAQKYNLEFSKKTCFDSLDFTPLYPEYKSNN